MSIFSVPRYYSANPTPFGERITSAILGVAVVLVAACATREQPTDDVRLSNATRIDTLVASSDTAVVILIDPSDCISCSPSLSTWYLIRRSHPVYYIFTRTPTEGEARLLALHRLEAIGIVTNGSVHLKPRTHRVIAYRQGVKWIEETVGFGHSKGTILSRLGWGGPTS